MSLKCVFHHEVFKPLRLHAFSPDWHAWPSISLDSVITCSLLAQPLKPYLLGPAICYPGRPPNGTLHLFFIDESKKINQVDLTVHVRNCPGSLTLRHFIEDFYFGCISACLHVCSWCLQRLKKSIKSPGTGTTDACEL